MPFRAVAREWSSTTAWSPLTMRHSNLSCLRKHFAQFGKGTGDKVRLAAIATGERMSTHHGPIDIVSDMCEKGGSVALLQTFEYFTNEVRCNRHLISP